MSELYSLRAAKSPTFLLTVIRCHIRPSLPPRFFGDNVCAPRQLCLAIANFLGDMAQSLVPSDIASVIQARKSPMMLAWKLI